MELKFRYVFQHEDTGHIMFQYFTIEQIEGSNFIKQCKEKFKRWILIDRNLYIDRKDKFDKEIYNGDILSESTLDKVIWDDSGRIIERPYGVVEFNKYGGQVKQVNKGKVKLIGNKSSFLDDGNGFSELNMSFYDGQYEWNSDIEVIGNIYENTDLLKIRQ